MDMEDSRSLLSLGPKYNGKGRFRIETCHYHKAVIATSFAEIKVIRLF
jgi:hypothetical protein